MNYFLTFAYDGTAYCGFQVQPKQRSVASTIQDALEAVLGSRPDIKGCSRTDAGVHAEAFALNFHLDPPLKFPIEKLPLALNAHLPRDVRALRACIAPEAFHARYAAHEKTYCYRIRNSAIESPFLQAYETRVLPPLDVQRMNEAAQYLIGTHDFIALCSAGSSAAAHGDTVRTISACSVSRTGDVVEITVRADGYLYNMVRILAGTLAEVGMGRREPSDITGILEGKNRAMAGQTLAAKGLRLVCVDYPEDAFTVEG